MTTVRAQREEQARGIVRTLSTGGLVTMRELIEHTATVGNYAVFRAAEPFVGELLTSKGKGAALGYINLSGRVLWFASPEPDLLMYRAAQHLMQVNRRRLTMGENGREMWDALEKGGAQHRALARIGRQEAEQAEVSQRAMELIGWTPEGITELPGIKRLTAKRERWVARL